jgi:hypothetical protein
MGIYLFTQEWFDIQQVLVLHIVLRSGYLFIYTGMAWYTTSFSGTCCFKEWAFIYLHRNGLIYNKFYYYILIELK